MRVNVQVSIIDHNCINGILNVPFYLSNDYFNGGWAVLETLDWLIFKKSLSLFQVFLEHAHPAFLTT